MISSFFGSFRFGSIEFDFAANWLFCAPSTGRPFASNAPFHPYVATPPVTMLFGLMLANSDVYIVS